MVLFTLQFHSVLDVITNSSSELFVGLHKSRDLMIELVKEIYPRYMDEYSRIRTIDELSDDDIDVYLHYHYDCWSNSQQRTIHSVVDGFEFDDMYEIKRYGDNDYTVLKENFVSSNRDKINDGIDLERKMFFMFSLDDNPNWDMQERLESIMTRYHLG